MASRGEASAGRRRRDFWEQAGHDLRQPVQSLQLLSHVFARGDADESVRQGADHMRRVVDDLARMHAALLRLARLESGEAAPAGRAVPFGPLIRDVAQGLADRAREQNTTLRPNAVEGSAEADAETLTVILQGLVLLALRHSEGEEIAVGAETRADGASIMVGFDGEGIPEEESGAVFLEAAGPGERRTILGPRYLARLARLHGYDLALGEGQGGRRCFRLTLPAR